MTTETASPPELQEYCLRDRDGDICIFAQLLGASSSWREHKSRWFEVAIYKTSDGEYIVYTKGMTNVPKEITKLRVVRTRSSFEVLQVLEVGRRDEPPYIPRDSMRALAQAAQWDDDLMERYLDARG
jgi:hypothetical protein